MIEAALARKDVHEPQVNPVHGDGARQRLQLAQTAELAEAPARLPLLHQDFER